MAKENTKETLENDSIDIYNPFGLTPSATFEEIKASYKQLLLKTHPDKNIDKTETERDGLAQEFLQISRYYQILSDPVLRKRYDLTGQVEESSSTADMDWKEYFDEMYKKITTEDIEKFKSQYRYSDEEKRDVLQEYCNTKGCLLTMIDRVKLSDYDDIPRFRKIIEEAIDQGVVGKFKKFPSVNQRELKKRVNKLKKEEKEAAEMGEKIEGEQGLATILKKRNEDRLKNLLEKLQGGEEPPMPSEQDFQAARAKLEKRSNSESSKPKPKKQKSE